MFCFSDDIFVDICFGLQWFAFQFQSLQPSKEFGYKEPIAMYEFSASSTSSIASFFISITQDSLPISNALQLIFSFMSALVLRFLLYGEILKLSFWSNSTVRLLMLPPRCLRGISRMSVTSSMSSKKTPVFLAPELFS